MDQEQQRRQIGQATGNRQGQPLRGRVQPLRFFKNEHGWPVAEPVFDQVQQERKLDTLAQRRVKRGGCRGIGDRQFQQVAQQGQQRQPTSVHLGHGGFDLPDLPDGAVFSGLRQVKQVPDNLPPRL